MRDIELCDRMTLSVMEDVKLLEPTKYLTRERERERAWDLVFPCGTLLLLLLVGGEGVQGQGTLTRDRELFDIMTLCK